MKPFQERFEEYQFSVSGLSSLADDSFLHWQKNYLDEKSTLQVSDFLPGKIYSIDYNDRLEKNKKFINKRPVIFFMGFFNYEDKMVFGGLDLILIPPQYRLAFFIRISSVYESQISTNIERLKKGDALDQVQLKCSSLQLFFLLLRARIHVHHFCSKHLMPYLIQVGENHLAQNLYLPVLSLLDR